MADQASRVTATIDLLADGKRHGYLTVPHSSNESAWGSVRVPITLVQNGAGPCLLLTGGNHGDEYEGPIALMKLARALEPGDITGRVIIIPALNLPAVTAGTRLSPIDGLNMNRVFPGARDGGVTSMIADYVTRELLPLADAAVDLHAGGKTLMLLPCTVVHEVDDPAQMEKMLAALRAFGAPYGLVLRELDSEGMIDTTVEGMGKVFLSTELGGGGTATPASVGIAEAGVARLLSHFGLRQDAAAVGRETATRLLHTPSPDCFLTSDDRGILELMVELGGEVMRGDPVCQIHRIERPAEPPRLYRAGADGLLVCRHHLGLVQPGDCLAVIASDYPQS